MMLMTTLACTQLSPHMPTVLALQPSSAFLVCKGRFNNAHVAPFLPHLTSPHLQLKGEALQERANVPRAPTGAWDDVAIVLTHDRLPPQYRRSQYGDASGYLRGLRNDASASYNKLGIYMLQIDALGFELVRSLNYVQCGTGLDALWAAHLDAVLKKATEDFNNGITSINPGTDGFKANKTQPIIGGDSHSLSRHIPNATFRDVMPKHLLPPDGMSLVPRPNQNAPPLPSYLPDALSNTPAPSHEVLASSSAAQTPARVAPHPSQPSQSASLTPNQQLTPHRSSTSRRSYIPPAGPLPTAQGAAAATALDLTRLLSGESPAAVAARSATAPQSGA
jgi:hypothetical protein